MRPGERVSAGDVILVIEPSAGRVGGRRRRARARSSCRSEPDPLEVFRGDGGVADFERAGAEAGVGARAPR